MTFSRANPAGYGSNDPITAAQMETIDVNQSRAVDGNAGGAYTPSSKISVNAVDIAPDAQSGYSITRGTFEQTESGGGGTASLTIFTASTNDQEIEVTAHCVAREASGTDRAVYRKTRGLKVTGGTLSTIGATVAEVELEDDATWDFGIGISGQNINLQLSPDATNDTTFTGDWEIRKREA